MRVPTSLPGRCGEEDYKRPQELRWLRPELRQVLNGGPVTMHLEPDCARALCGIDLTCPDGAMVVRCGPCRADFSAA